MKKTCRERVPIRHKQSITRSRHLYLPDGNSSLSLQGKHGFLFRSRHNQFVFAEQPAQSEIQLFLILRACRFLQILRTQRRTSIQGIPYAACRLTDVFKHNTQILLVNKRNPLKGFSHKNRAKVIFLSARFVIKIKKSTVLYVILTQERLFSRAHGTVEPVFSGLLPPDSRR